MSVSSNLIKGAGWGGTALMGLKSVAPGALAGLGAAAAPLSFGLSAVPLLVTALQKVHAGARNATEFVNGYQDALLKNVLAPASAKANAGDPQGAAQDVAQGWATFLKSANDYAAKNPTSAKVVDQMLNKTPQLQQTVDTLLKPLGVTSQDPQFVNGQTFQAQGKDPSLLGAAAPLIATAGIYAGSKLLGGQGQPSGSTGAAGGGVPDYTGAAGAPGGGTAGPQTQGFWGKLGNVLGVGGGNNGNSGSGTGTNGNGSVLGTLANLGSDIFGGINNNNTSNNAQKSLTGAPGVNGGVGTGILGAEQQVQKGADTARTDILNGQTQAVDANQAAVDKIQQNNTAALGQIQQGNATALGQITANNQPYVDAGKSGLMSLSQAANAPVDTTLFDPAAVSKEALADPGFQFRLDEAIQGLKRSYANGGQGIASGDTMKALDKWGQDYSSNEYGAANARVVQNRQDLQQAQNDRFTRLMSLTSVGQGATNSTNAAVSGFAGADQSATQGLDTNTNASLQNQSNNLSDLYKGTGTSLGNLATGTGSSLATLAGSQGSVNAVNNVTNGNNLGSTVGNIANDVTKLISLNDMRSKNQGAAA